MYAYVGGNPVNFIDPLGLRICWPWGNCTGDEYYPPTDRTPPIDPNKPPSKTEPQGEECKNFLPSQDGCVACCAKRNVMNPHLVTPCVIKYCFPEAANGQPKICQN